MIGKNCKLLEISYLKNKLIDIDELNSLIIRQL